MEKKEIITIEKNDEKVFKEMINLKCRIIQRMK